MTVPPGTVNDIRSMEAAERSRSEIARTLHLSRNTVAKCADMEDMSPAAPLPAERARPALEGHEERIEGVLGGPSKRHGTPGEKHREGTTIQSRSSSVPSQAATWIRICSESPSPHSLLCPNRGLP